MVCLREQNVVVLLILTAILGPSYQLLQLLDRHPMRPAHIHVTVSGDGYKSLTTQIYPNDDPWLETDTVFAVKDDLVVDFTPLKGDPKAERELKYDFKLAQKGVKGASGGAQPVNGTHI